MLRKSDCEPAQWRVYETLRHNEPMSVDDLAQLLRLSDREVRHILSFLRLRGAVDKMTDGRWAFVK